MRDCERRLEARVGIEPTRKGFADLSLTTWVPRPTAYVSVPAEKSPSQEWPGGGQKIWSGRRGSNPRHRPWQGRALPLSYSRSYFYSIAGVRGLTIQCAGVGTRTCFRFSLHCSCFSGEP